MLRMSCCFDAESLLSPLQYPDLSFCFFTLSHYLSVVLPHEDPPDVAQPGGAAPAPALLQLRPGQAEECHSEVERERGELLVAVQV